MFLEMRAADDEFEDEVPLRILFLLLPSLFLGRDDYKCACEPGLAKVVNLF